MKKVLMTAYDVNPYKGSESGMGWNFIRLASKENMVLAITRENNRASIERYIRENEVDTDNVRFYYYDLPYALRFWKRGARGSSLYFYLWQMFMPIYVWRNKICFDIAHNLNFHTDAFPSFLWVFGKPFLWGPINHHEKIDRRFILPVYGVKAYVKDRLVWLLKKILWNLDPFIYLSKSKADKIFCGSSAVGKRLRLLPEKCIPFSSVGSENVDVLERVQRKGFRILSAGRFVPLKGFDVTIRSFVKFANENPEIEGLELILIGSGPEENRLKTLSSEVREGASIKFISWIERSELVSFYRNADIFFFPSHEGAGMVVMEALSYGVPVLCFDNNGPGELIGSNCGVKISYDGYDQVINQFASALLDLYSDGGKRKNFSDNCIERFQSEFVWSKKGEVFEKVYGEIDGE